MTLQEIQTIKGWIKGYFEGRTLPADLLSKHSSFADAEKEGRLQEELRLRFEEELDIWAMASADPDVYQALVEGMENPEKN